MLIDISNLGISTETSMKEFLNHYGLKDTSENRIRVMKSALFQLNTRKPIRLEF